MQTKKYSKKDFDLDRIASSVKLGFDDEEKIGFLTDICDMTNYVYDKLAGEGADCALAISASRGQTLDELREDAAGECGAVEDILNNAPKMVDGHIAVPKTVETTEGEL